MSHELALRARLAAPPNTVHHALTATEALQHWLAEYADSAVADGRFEFWGRFTPQGERGRQRLIESTPGRSLVFAWTLDGVETTVRITLEADGADHTQLSLRQSPLPTLDELMNPRGRRDGLHSMHTFWGLALAELAEHVEGRPLTPKVDFRVDRAPVIRTGVTIAAPPERVFASLVDPEQIERWFGWRAEVEPYVGGRMSLGVEGRISEFEPGKLLAYGDGEGGIVRWELADSGGGTHLTFVQSGFSPSERDSAAQHEAGWLAGIAELRRMHELGDAWTPVTTELPSDPQDAAGD
jgi:uncharacterized protein YndB with AHSA1/START domain